MKAGSFSVAILAALGRNHLSIWSHYPALLPGGGSKEGVPKKSALTSQVMHGGLWLIYFVMKQKMTSAVIFKIHFKFIWKKAIQNNLRNALCSPWVYKDDKKSEQKHQKIEL